MNLTKIQKDIIISIMMLEENSRFHLPPSIEDLKKALKLDYCTIETESTVLELILDGVIEPEFYKLFLRFTEHFKHMKIYRELKETNICSEVNF